MLNLNPELVDQDKIRKLKRKRLLKYASVPCLLLILCSIFVFRIGIFNVVYGVSYSNQNYEVANSMAEAQGLGNVITPYLRYYDGGVAKLRQKMNVDAEKDFRASLKENPPEEVLCMIYTNLSLSIELQADEKFQKELYDEALILYAKAQSTLYSNGCAEKDSDAGKDALAKSAKTRIDGKMSKTMNKINSVADDDPDDPGTQSPEKELSQNQINQLNERRQNQNEVSWQVRNGVGSSAGKYCSPSSGDVCW
ncbi:hypothetical protein J5500_03960 [Candidatus Saccharibacteria bacterium]|nr:hypothetical protein [Candidatus Saccharibacteria bacterium]